MGAAGKGVADHGEGRLADAADDAAVAVVRHPAGVAGGAGANLALPAVVAGCRLLRGGSARHAAAGPNPLRLFRVTRGRSFPVRVLGGIVGPECELRRLHRRDLPRGDPEYRSGADGGSALAWDDLSAGHATGGAATGGAAGAAAADE